MNEAGRLLATVKRELRKRGLTYHDVAVALGLSEASVKRLFASGRFTLDRVARLAELLGLTLAELAQEAMATETKIRELTVAQENTLVADTKLLLVAVCALNHWTLAEIVAAYRVSEAEGIERLVHLERLRLIDLLPNNRIRIVVARDFDWLPDGPIRHYFRARGQADFLACAFTRTDEAMLFAHGMLTESGAKQLRAELDKLRRKFAELHDEALASPFGQRQGTGLMMAARPWEPPDFAALRR
ncbi:MAG: helix-turn-helix transcriptional regulator [Thiobacillus sp.]|nr:helix-turn-helix transcriptional regulator [Thiobacillus sp.]